MPISSTNVAVGGSSSSSVLSHYGSGNTQSSISDNRLFQDLAFIPYYSGATTRPRISFSDFAGARGAMNHSLGSISLSTSEPQYEGDLGSNSIVQYQAQDPSTGRGDRIVCTMYDTSDGVPGSVSVNSYFITTTSGSATLQLDWDVQDQITGGHAIALVRSYQNGYLSGSYINNGLYEGTSSISSLSCSMNASYPHTVISLGIWGPGQVSIGPGARGSAIIYRARLR